MLFHTSSLVLEWRQANTMLGVVALLTSGTVPSGLMGFFCAYFAVGGPCFCLPLLGPQPVTLKRAKLCDNSTTSTSHTNKPDLTRVHLEGVTVLSVTGVSEAFWSLSPFSRHDATPLQDGEKQTLWWSYAGGQVQPFTAGQKVLPQPLRFCSSVLRYYLEDLHIVHMILFPQLFNLFGAMKIIQLFVINLYNLAVHSHTP